jgi:hypothetical protein
MIPHISIEPEGEPCLFQDRLPFMLEACSSFDPVRVWEHGGDHQSFGEGGERIYQWVAPFYAIQDFIEEKLCSTLS